VILYILAAPFVLLYEFLASVVGWLWDVLVALSPLLGIAVGVVCVVAAILSALVAIVPARKMARAKRVWVRVLGWVLGCIEVVASLAFAGIAVIAFAAVAIYT
jgi:hypothetical protein